MRERDGERGRKRREKKRKKYYYTGICNKERERETKEKIDKRRER